MKTNTRAAWEIGKVKIRWDVGKSDYGKSGRQKREKTPILECAKIPILKNFFWSLESSKTTG